MGEETSASGGHAASEGDLKKLVVFKRNVKTSEGIILGLAYRHAAAFIELLCTVILPNPEVKWC